MPLACDLGQVLPQLAYLRSFEGVVDLALKKAAALDPEELASRPDGDSAREVCNPASQDLHTLSPIPSHHLLSGLSMQD